MKIEQIKARKILNSRGQVTIEIDIRTDKGKGRGSAPSGASTGEKEVQAMPRSTEETISIANGLVAEKLKGLEINKFDDLEKVEKKLKEIDNTENLSKIGGNLIIALEFAILHALADSVGKPLWKAINPKAQHLPRPLGNCVGGGAHAGTNSPDIQEFLLLSLDAENYKEALFANTKIHRLMKEELQKIDKEFTGGKTDEGAWTPNITNLEILDHLFKISRQVAKEAGVKVRLGLDVASSELWDGENYVYKKYLPEKKEKKLSREEQIQFVIDMIEKYDLCYVEDPLEENDFEGFAQIKRAANNCLICGDDLTVTNPEVLKKAIEHESINAIIVKPNQIGSLIKTREVVELAKKNKITPVISHRSGETTDDTIAHLAVAFDIPVIKCGIVGGERLAKLNELLRIEEVIKD